MSKHLRRRLDHLEHQDGGRTAAAVVIYQPGAGAKAEPCRPQIDRQQHAAVIFIPDNGRDREAESGKVLR